MKSTLAQRNMNQIKATKLFHHVNFGPKIETNQSDKTPPTFPSPQSKQTKAKTSFDNAHLPKFSLKLSISVARQR